ncbi:hypothetical protein AB6813_07135 [bacterium RCC_150]
MQEKTRASRAITAVIVALGLCLVQPSVAFASAPTLDDANQILSKTSTKVQVTSHLVGPTDSSLIAPRNMQKGGSDKDRPIPSKVALSSSGAVQVFISSGNEQTRPDRKITAAFAYGKPKVSGDTAVISTSGNDRKLYVRSTPSGADVFIALGGPKAERVAVFDYDLPPGHTVSDGIPGFKNFYSAQGDYLGSVKQASARDSAGNEVLTTLDISAATMTQTVQPTSATVYPVVMSAPSWTYNFEFPLGYGNNVEPFNLLRSCFNCYFPINGATSTYPYMGQVLNLKILVAGAIQVPAPVRVGYAGNFYFQFTALAGHFDGEGSVINFASIPKPNGDRALNVNAAIVMDRGVLNVANQYAAHGQWYQFASNLCLGLWRTNASACNWTALYPPY